MANTASPDEPARAPSNSIQKLSLIHKQRQRTAREGNLREGGRQRDLHSRKGRGKEERHSSKRRRNRKLSIGAREIQGGGKKRTERGI